MIKEVVPLRALNKILRLQLYTLSPKVYNRNEKIKIAMYRFPVKRFLQANQVFTVVRKNQISLACKWLKTVKSLILLSSGQKLKKKNYTTSSKTKFSLKTSLNMIINYSEIVNL